MVLSILTFTPMTLRLTGNCGSFLWPASRGRGSIVSRIPSQGRDQNSKLEVGFPLSTP